jgi:hypothetical protein
VKRRESGGTSASHLLFHDTQELGERLCLVNEGANGGGAPPCLGVHRSAEKDRHAHSPSRDETIRQCDAIFRSHLDIEHATIERFVPSEDLGFGHGRRHANDVTATGEASGQHLAEKRLVFDEQEPEAPPYACTPCLSEMLPLFLVHGSPNLGSVCADGELR